MKYLFAILAFLPFALCAQFVGNPYMLDSGGGGGGPDVWYYPGGLGENDFSDGNSTQGWQPSSYAYGSEVTVTTGGTCTQLGVRVEGVFGTNPTVKIALYDSSFNLISSSTADTVLVSNGVEAWYDVTLASTVNVSSATNYYVILSASSNNTLIHYDDSADGVGDSVTYANFPESTYSPGTESNTRWGVRMYVD